MSASKTKSRSVRKRARILEPALEKQVVGLSPEDRLSLARVYERWARQLRRSIAEKAALVRTFIKEMPEEAVKEN